MCFQTSLLSRFPLIGGAYSNTFPLFMEVVGLPSLMHLSSVSRNILKISEGHPRNEASLKTRYLIGT